MRWTINGKDRWHSDRKYRINWNRPAPSKGAQQLKDFLYKHCKNHVLYEEYCVPSTKLRCDYLDATLKVVFEYDCKKEKGHHNHFIKHFHKTRVGFFNAIKRDMKKEEILEQNGYKVLRIYEEDLPLTKKWFEEQGIIL